MADHIEIAYEEAKSAIEKLRRAAGDRSCVVEIPKHLADAIKRCWPDGAVEQFPADELHFHEIQHQIERDLDYFWRLTRLGDRRGECGQLG